MSENLHSRVLAELGQAIVDGRHAPGQILRTDELELSFGVSRSVMREAIRVLVSMDLVESRRSVGITVLDSTRWHPFNPEIIRWRLAGPGRVAQLLALGELRAGVEPIAAQLAARRAAPEQAADLMQAVVAMSIAARNGDLEALLESDIKFHRTLLSASANAMFTGLASVVEEVLRGRAEHHLVDDSREYPEIELHLNVAVAVLGGDETRARIAMEKVLNEASHTLRVAASRVSELEPDSVADRGSTS